MVDTGARNTNWAGNVAFGAGEVLRPRTVEQLQHAVRAAGRVRPLGTGHSFNRIADTSGTQVSVARLDLPIELDPAAFTVRVPGGVRYAELAAHLHARGWALQNLGSLPHISVAGACATGTHGSGDTNRSLPNAAVAVEFVRGDGELVRFDEGDEAFAGAVLSLGALGVVTRLTLRVEPAYELRQDVDLDLPVPAVLAHLEDILGSAYSVSLFSTFGRPQLIDQVWRKARRDAPPAESFGAAPATAAQHPIPGADPSATSPQLGVPGPWHARLPHFRAEFTPSSGDELQSEFFVPRPTAPAALEALLAVADRFAAALQVFELRSVAADRLWLSPCHDRDTVTLHFTWVPEWSVVRPALQAVEAALAPFDPRPHWGKVFLDADRGRFAECYPQLPAFRALAAGHDPDGRFRNDFLDRFVLAP